MTVLRLVCFSTLLLALAGCRKAGEKPPAPGDLAPDAVVVRVGDAALTFAEMDKRASGYLKHAQEREGLAFGPNMLPEAKAFYRKRAISAFVYKTVMLNEAARLEVTVSPRDRTEALQKLTASLAKKHSNTNDYFNRGSQPPDVMRSEFEDSIVIDKMLNREVQRTIKVMDSEVTQMVAEIGESNAVRRATLEAARQQILAGAAFEDVARTISEDSGSAKRGGDLGEFAHDKFTDKAFADAVFGLPVGQVSEVVESDAGYHLIKVAAHNPAQAEKDGAPAVPETVRAAHIFIRALPVVPKNIAAVIYNRKFSEGCRALYENLRAKEKVECPLYPDMVFEPFLR